MKGLGISLLVCLMGGLWAVPGQAADKETPKGDTRIFEIRTYYPNPGKMEALHARFRNHTCRLFKKHGIEIIGFWVPSDPEKAEQKLVYIVAFPSAEAAKKSWQSFLNDPVWKAAKAASEKDGVLVGKIESVYLKATDYSSIK